MTRRKFLQIAAALLLTLGTGATPGSAENTYILVASTTSTENSGLFAHILPVFQNETGIEVRVVAVGTGQAVDLARRGDADVLFVHHTPSEEKFVAEGFGVARHDVMYNDFVIVGPESDPAAIKGMTSAADALKQVADKTALFASRGDESGTHKKELSLWKAAGVDVEAASGTWYRETGSGMGATLNTASGLGAYALTDRATWLAFENKGDLAVLVEGDPKLFNQYGVILVNPEKFPHVKAEAGQRFVDWIIGSDGQKAIADFRIGGQQLFFPNARPGA
ncbi:MAG: substrate-binding domain-containing protein [Rhodospirillales bacterium]|nr:substrate-binding domain-containing protein [Rhodospirillales bacterium]